jgi:hypothetical protein
VKESLLGYVLGQGWVPDQVQRQPVHVALARAHEFLERGRISTLGPADDLRFGLPHRLRLSRPGPV